MPAKRNETVRAIDAYVGARLRALRELRGLSQGELARRLGFRSRQAVAAYEAGDAISAAVLFQLTAILQVDPHHFFDGFTGERAQLAEETAAPPTTQAAKISALLARTPAAHHAAILSVVRAMAKSLADDDGAPEPPRPDPRG